MTLYLAVALGSALGGALRHALSEAFAALFPRFPWGTLLVNVTGCVGIGMLAVALPGQGAAASVLITGLLGGYTTVSSFGLQTLGLLQSRRPVAAAANVFGSVSLCLLAAALGASVAQLWLGTAP